MAWRTSLWVRWLGWTALFGVAVFVVGSLLGFDVSSPVAFLAPPALAFGIGARFRSWWWGAGPLALIAAPVAAMTALAWVRDTGSEAWVWGVAFTVMAVLYGGVCSLAGLAGVWWGTRRRAAATGAYDDTPVDRSPAPGADPGVHPPRAGSRGP